MYLNINFQVEQPELHAPEFVIEIGDLTVKEGEGATLTCKVKGQPVPEITWFYEGQPIKSDEIYKVIPGELEGESTLKIPEVFTEDAGSYTVKATNEAGVVESSATLNVTGKLITSPYCENLCCLGSCDVISFFKWIHSVVNKCGILISWLHQKPVDMDLHCFQKRK